jgi:hypothetical protein
MQDTFHVSSRVARLTRRTHDELMDVSIPYKLSLSDITAVSFGFNHCSPTKKSEPSYSSLVSTSIIQISASQSFGTSQLCCRWLVVLVTVCNSNLRSWKDNKSSNIGFILSSHFTVFRQALISWESKLLSVSNFQEMLQRTPISQGALTQLRAYPNAWKLPHGHSVGRRRVSLREML